MKNIYYIYWVDSIIRSKKNNPNDNHWIRSLLILNSAIFAFNLSIILLWLKYFNVDGIYSFIHIDVFPGSFLNGCLSYFIQYIAPFYLLNYYLIFYRNRYKRLLEKYNAPKYNYAGIYSLVVLALLLISVIFYGLLNIDKIYFKL